MNLIWVPVVIFNTAGIVNWENKSVAALKMDVRFSLQNSWFKDKLILFPMSTAFFNRVKHCSK